MLLVLEISLLQDIVDSWSSESESIISSAHKYLWSCNFHIWSLEVLLYFDRLRIHDKVEGKVCVEGFATFADAKTEDLVPWTPLKAGEYNYKIQMYYCTCSHVLVPTCTQTQMYMYILITNTVLVFVLKQYRCTCTCIQMYMYILITNTVLVFVLKQYRCTCTCI